MDEAIDETFRKMSFKIVSTRRRGRPELCIVPSQWEDKGQLRWPKYNADMLSKNSSVQPAANWLTMPCILKRKNFRNYEDAEIELAIMIDKTDTDTDFEQSSCAQRARTLFNSTAASPNFNSLAQDLIDPVTNIIVAPSQTPNHVIADDEGVMYTVVSEGTSRQIENVATQQSVCADGHQTLEGIHNIYTIQQLIMENQDKIMKRLAELSVQIEEMKYSLPSNSTVIPLGQAKGIEVQPFTFKAINDACYLEILDQELSNQETFEKLKQQYSIVCSKLLGNGNNCAYRLLDLMFTKEFLCKCSWTGGSRNSSDVKIGFKAFKNVIIFFFSMVNFWDSTYTIQDNENFFKTVLRNALKRKQMRNIRSSAKKCRVKRKNDNNNENNNGKGKINSAATETRNENNNNKDDRLIGEEEDNNKKDDRLNGEEKDNNHKHDRLIGEEDDNNKKDDRLIGEEEDEESLC